jgi:hemerythrin-like domain-containing protein
MVALLNHDLAKVEKGEQINLTLIDAAVDFFKTYADRTHHGKEEDILFRELDVKQLSQDHRKIMDELKEEHIRARSIVTRIANAGQQYVKDGSDNVDDIKRSLNDLVHLYPAHIEKEDKHFFYPILEYFSSKEQNDMLTEFWEFDRNMIHERYRMILEQFEGNK